MNFHDHSLPTDSLSGEIDRSLSDLASDLVDDPIEVGARLADLIERREAAEDAALARLSATAQALEVACRELHSTETFDDIVPLVCPAVAAISAAEFVLFATLDGLLSSPLASSLGPIAAVIPTGRFTLPQEFAESGIPTIFSHAGLTAFRVDVDGHPAAAIYVDATMDPDTIGAVDGYAEAIGSTVERAGLERRRSHQSTLFESIQRRQPNRQSHGSGHRPRAIAQGAQQPEAPRSAEMLTSRESEILGLLLTGRSNAAIATNLVVSVETVRSHVKRVLRKCGASNRAELIARYGDGRS